MVIVVVGVGVTEEGDVVDDRLSTSDLEKGEIDVGKIRKRKRIKVRDIWRIRESLSLRGRGIAVVKAVG